MFLKKKRERERGRERERNRDLTDSKKEGTITFRNEKHNWNRHSTGVYNSRLDIAEERINELDKCSKERKRDAKYKREVRDMGHKMKRSNVYQIRVPEGEE